MAVYRSYVYTALTFNFIQNSKKLKKKKLYDGHENENISFCLKNIHISSVLNQDGNFFIFSLPNFEGNF